MNKILKSIAGMGAVAFIGLVSITGFRALAASSVIDTPIALFSTSLASPITSTASTMTLVSGVTGDGTTLASSTYSFIIDQGQSDQEFVRANCTNTTCTAMQRGLSIIDGSTTISSLAFQHRRGQSVSITDAPLLLVLTNILNGNNGFPVPLLYISSIAPSSFTNAQQLASKGYVDSVAFSGAGVINATAAARGVVQLATGLQAANSVVQGSTGANLALPASIATSTYNAATAPYNVVVTQSNGYIDSNFVSTSTLFSAAYYGGSPIDMVGKNMQVFSKIGTSTFSVPAGVQYFYVEVQGGGGNGGSVSGCGSTCYNGGGGAAEYIAGLEHVTGTSTVLITVGSSTNPSSFGTSTQAFYLSANAGNTPTVQTGNNPPNSAVGGATSTVSTAFLDIAGQNGGSGTSIVGFGGSSHLGSGGLATLVPPGGYGAGGSGCATSGTCTGGTGGQGVVIIRW